MIWATCSLWAVQVRREPHVFMILWRAPVSEVAKGPWRRDQPPGLVTKIVAKSFMMDEKWHLRRHMLSRAMGIKRRVEGDWTGPEDRASALDLTLHPKPLIVITMDQAVPEPQALGGPTGT